MRYTISTMEAIEKMGLEGSNTKEKIEKLSYMMRYDHTYDEHPDQLRHMQAWIYNYNTLKSYRTLVAYFDGCNVYEMGYYSMTTSKQVSAWAAEHGADVYRITDLYSTCKNYDIRIWFDDIPYYNKLDLVELMKNYKEGV